MKIEFGGEDSEPIAGRVDIPQKPEHGTVQTGWRSITYNSKRGFSGVDTFRWKVGDGPKANTGEIRVTVEPDKTPPEITAIESVWQEQVKLTYSEPVAASAANPEHYHLDHGAEITEAVLKNNNTEVVLRTSGLQPNVDYTLTVSDVKDRAEAGNVLKRSTHSFKRTGLRFDYYHPWKEKQLPDREFSGLSDVKSGIVEIPSLRVAQHEDHFAMRFIGRISIPEKGTYIFFTASDDGSRLYIDGELVVDNGGTHPTTTVSGDVTLDAGQHAITVTYFEHTGGQSLNVSWQGPDFHKRKISAEVLSAE